MPKFKNYGTGNRMGLGLLSALGLIVAGVLLAAWSLVIVAMIIVPATIAAALAVRTVRRMTPPTDNRRYRSTIIEGEYEVLNSGNTKG